MKKYQVMNRYGVTLCGLIVDDKTKTYTYYPRQNMPCCIGKKISRNRMQELLAKVQKSGYTPI